MSELYQLPDGWEWKTIEDLCEILDRLRKPISQKDRISGEFPYYGASGILDYINDFIFDERLLLIGEDGAKWGANENTSFIADGKYWVNNHAHIMRPNKDLVIDSLLVYYLNATDLGEYITGATVKKLNQQKLKSIKIPLPPLSEQKRIVSKLDLLFEKIDKAIALHQKNMDEADAFMGSVLNDVFGELEEKYPIKTLNDVCSKITDGTHKSPKTIESGYPYITVRDVTDKGKIDFDNCEFVNEEDFQRLKDGNCAPIKNDVLFSKDGTVGKVTAVDFQKDFVVLSSLAILRPSDNLDSFFLFYTMKSPKFFEFAQSRKTGAAIKRVVLRTIKEFEIPYPPLNTQQKVVKYLDEISEKIEKVKSVQKEKMDSLKALKASILDKAFRGEL